jgi:hypothetical protein
MNALKHGLHALKAVEKGKHGGFNIGGCAVKAGRSIQTISREVQAAKVWADFHPGGNSDAFKLPVTKPLAELHVAEEWLWPALIGRLVQDGWMVETARAPAARIKGVPDPDAWADREAIVEALVAGEMRPADVRRLKKHAADAHRRLATVRR